MKKKIDHINSLPISLEFYQEMFLLRAQELIAELMEQKGISRSQLAKRTGLSNSRITFMLSDERNLTLRTLAKVCYHLGYEVIPSAILLPKALDK